jgi:uncharacterized protein (DUF2267 family)
VTTTTARPERDEARASIFRTIEERGELPPHATPESVVSEVMCALVERVTPGVAHDLLQALPAPLHPLLAPCVAHRMGPVNKFRRGDLLDRVADRRGITPQHADRVCRAVFATARASLCRVLLSSVIREDVFA